MSESQQNLPVQRLLKEQQRRIDALEQRLREAKGRRDLRATPRYVGVGKTISSGTYPTDGNTFEFVFTELSYTKSAGTQSQTYTDRSASAHGVGQTLNSKYIPINTYCWVLEERNAQYVLIPFPYPRAVLAEGTATSGGDDTLTDTGASWPTFDVGTPVIIYAGTGAGQCNYIASNTSTELTMLFDWPSLNPDNTSEYIIGPACAEGSTYFHDPQYFGDDVYFGGTVTGITPTAAWIDGDDCWLGLDGDNELVHLQPYTETDPADCDVFHEVDFTIESGMCYMKFDDAGHLIGYLRQGGSWTSPWSISEPF